jgi:valyl-tRNA synthetase
MFTLTDKFSHSQDEKELSTFWEKEKFFHAKNDSNKKPYVVLIPPPNVTDKLHMGHGLNNTIQDILVRRKRMQDFDCLWLPGVDHAGIATQMMVEKRLLQEGSSRIELGREKFLVRCAKWKEENGHIIIDQLKRLGASCDWQRQAYTMDSSLSAAVRKIFVQLYEQGFIYRGQRLVNWDPKLQTAVSDDEVENKEVQGNLWHYKYPIDGVKDSYLVVATTRPETMLGDSAVAVHPDDPRYKHLIGLKAVVPFVNRKVPIVADEYVKPEFGTGCVKITPAHDPNDFEVGKRHKLEFINIMNSDASMNELCPKPFCGLDRFAARELIVKELKKLGLFVETKPCRHSIPFSERSKVPIEPRLSKQWFVRMQELAKPALEDAKTDKLNFYPQTTKKTYCHWLENIKDWCISRQLWWGHRIPIWYCQSCQGVSTGIEDPSVCQHCGCSDIEQDKDVLDTWFSSWLWPISPFGWPQESVDLKRYFPSDVLVTGSDIIFLWVARMIMLSHYVKKQIPFKDIYFNAIICDKKGQKFSKTLGNGIDPIEVIDKHGADAVRFTCVSLASLGGRIKMDIKDFEHGAHFVNKIWNATRFIALLTKEHKDHKLESIKSLDFDIPTKWIIHELHLVSANINKSIDEYRINDAVDSMYHFVWGSFCDWYLECIKHSFNKADAIQKSSLLSALFYVFEASLRLLAPVMPFVTETIWKKLPSHPDWQRPSSLTQASYPEADVIPSFVEEHTVWLNNKELISLIRSIRTQAGIPTKERLSVYVECSVELQKQFAGCELYLKGLGGVKELIYSTKLERPEKSLVATSKGMSVFIPVVGFFDFEKEKKRLTQELARVKKIVFGLNKKLSSKAFIDKAPKDIIDKAQAQLVNMQEQQKSLNKNLEQL